MIYNGACLVFYLWSPVKEESKEAAKAEKAKAEKLETEKVDPMLDYRYDTTVSVAKYGYSARLKRSETLHRFLCYMVYNYEGNKLNFNCGPEC